MSKSKIMGIMALIAFAMGMALAGDAVAGEKFKCRVVWHTTKVERIDVDDEKGHLLSVSAYKGIMSNMEGKTFGEGWLASMTSIAEIIPKVGMTSYGYIILTDKDDHKIYVKYDQKPGGPYPLTIYKGTGKFERVQGKGTFSAFFTADPTRFYVNWDVEVELPR